jgi:hypothetical protein
VSLDGEIPALAEQVDARLSTTTWNLAALEPRTPADVSAAAEVAVFALKLAGKHRQARRGGRFGRLIVHFALAACTALASVAAACDKPDAAPEATQAAINELPPVLRITAHYRRQWSAWLPPIVPRTIETAAARAHVADDRARYLLVIAEAGG